LILINLAQIEAVFRNWYHSWVIDWRSI